MNDKIYHFSSSLRAFFRWSLFGIMTGVIAGGIASSFDLALQWANAYRISHPHIFLGLPLAGLVISWLYYHLGEKGDQGTNLVIESIRKKEYIPWYVAIRIFFATFLTHLFGGSAGWWAFSPQGCSPVWVWSQFSAVSPTVPSHPCSLPQNSLALTESIISWSTSASAICSQAVPASTPVKRYSIIKPWKCRIHPLSSSTKKRAMELRMIMQAPMMPIRLSLS